MTAVVCVLVLSFAGFAGWVAWLLIQSGEARAERGEAESVERLSRAEHVATEIIRAAERDAARADAAARAEIARAQLDAERAVDIARTAAKVLHKAQVEANDTVVKILAARTENDARLIDAAAMSKESYSAVRRGETSGVRASEIAGAAPAFAEEFTRQLASMGDELTPEAAMVGMDGM